MNPDIAAGLAMIVMSACWLIGAAFWLLFFHARGLIQRRTRTTPRVHQFPGGLPQMDELAAKRGRS